MNTVHELLRHADLSTEIAEDVTIPVVSGLPQCQGDIAIVPTKPGKSERAPIRIPREGIVLVRGQGGHAHLLIGDGTWTPGVSGAADLGTLEVGEDETAWLLHEEHGGNGIGAGCYRIGQQEEMWDAIRRVAD